MPVTPFTSDTEQFSRPCMRHLVIVPVLYSPPLSSEITSRTFLIRIRANRIHYIFLHRMQNAGSYNYIRPKYSKNTATLLPALRLIRYSKINNDPSFFIHVIRSRFLDRADGKENSSEHSRRDRYLFDYVSDIVDRRE